MFLSLRYVDFREGLSVGPVGSCVSVALLGFMCDVCEDEMGRVGGCGTLLRRATTWVAAVYRALFCRVHI